MAFFAAAGSVNSANIPDSRYGGKLDTTPVKMPLRHPAPPGEMHGVWVATIYNLDYPRYKNTAEFKKGYSQMCKNLKANNFNAVFFQVRPANDAFYKSKLNPWSRYLSGTEGVPLAGEKNFDPLKFMIDEAHRHGLEFHAWLNPYRVVSGTAMSKHKYLKTLAPGNFARCNPDLVIESPLPGGKRILVLNPAESRVRNFVTSTVMEIVNQYPVDSIHFDDYFYPDNAPANVDRAAYLKYNPRKLSLESWRQNNVTMLINSIHQQIAGFNRRNRRHVRFGVSPFGIWRNQKNSKLGSLSGGKESFNTQYADTRLWVKKGLIDYIVPQLYWHFNHDTAPYAALTDWWCKTVSGTNVDLYIGHAAYQLGEKNWNINQLYYQILYNRSKPQIKGSIIFSYRNLAAPSNPTMRRGAREMLKKVWAEPANAQKK